MEISDSFIDNLAAQTTLEEHGDVGFIVIPNVELLTEDQRNAVWQRAEQRLMQAPPINEALVARLQDMTPPPDQEEADEETRQGEAKARRELEQEGCPPCYPATLEVPLRNPPDEYRGIVEHWESLSGWGGHILWQQRSDWRRFRNYQHWYRSRLPGEKFSRHMENVRERRRRHGLPDVDVDLCLEPKEQTLAQNWLEYQYLHLGFSEKREAKMEELARKIEAEREQSGSDDATTAIATVGGTIPETIDEITRTGWPSSAQITASRLRGERLFAKRHKNLLRWIEMQRQAMDADGTGDIRGPLPSSSSSSARNTTRTRKQQNTEKAGIRGATRSSKRLQEKRAANARSDGALKSSRGARAPPGQKKKERARERRDGGDGPAPALLAVTRTRSGRISKPPVRWAP
ncbi:hypothetical protein GGR51DRAFT_529083 [Nemania sp. FL0031]|nr:hypothetical protein GGR51DRAFT_529083 [Nemania sp. FL0031]